MMEHVAMGFEIPSRHATASNLGISPQLVKSACSIASIFGMHKSGFTERFSAMPLDSDKVEGVEKCYSLGK